MLHEFFKAAMLKILNGAIVCVNVTRVLRSRHVENIEWGNCLCKCLHEFFEAAMLKILNNCAIVYVNITRSSIEAAMLKILIGAIIVYVNVT
jgi:hypothetical protein